MGLVKRGVVSDRVRNGGGGETERRGTEVTRSRIKNIYLLYRSRVLRYLYITFNSSAFI